MVSTVCECGGHIVDGQCNRNCKTKRRRDTNRPNSNQRGYDSEWRKFRDKYIKGKLCGDCEKEGRDAFADELHHIIKLRDAPHLKMAPDNLMPLCRRCHQKRTARGE